MVRKTAARLPVSGDFSQLEPQSLKLVGETDELGSFIAVLRPVLAVLRNGSARRSLIPLSFYIAFLVAPSRFGRLLSGHAGLKLFPSGGRATTRCVFSCNNELALESATVAHLEPFQETQTKTRTGIRFLWQQTNQLCLRMSLYTKSSISVNSSCMYTEST